METILTDPAIIRAVYADFKLVRTRRVVQLVFEVPLEGADQAHAVVGGMPDPEGSRWFAIARLNPEDKIDTPPALPAPDKRLAKQAGICCADPVFQTFLYEHDMVQEKTEESAKIAVRRICGCQSRSHIIPGSPYAERWIALHGKFLAWKEMG